MAYVVGYMEADCAVWFESSRQPGYKRPCDSFGKEAGRVCGIDEDLDSPSIELMDCKGRQRTGLLSSNPPASVQTTTFCFSMTVRLAIQVAPSDVQLLESGHPALEISRQPR